MAKKMIPIATTVTPEDLDMINKVREKYGNLTDAEILRYIIKSFIVQVKEKGVLK